MRPAIFWCHTCNYRLLAYDAKEYFKICITFTRKIVITKGDELSRAHKSYCKFISSIALKTFDVLIDIEVF